MARECDPAKLGKMSKRGREKFPHEFLVNLIFELGLPGA